MTHTAIGYITGFSAARVDNRPNMRGAMTVERGLPVGTNGPRKRDKDEVS